MFRRTVLSAFAIAAGVAAGILLKVLQDSKEERENDYDDDEEIHFIRINDDDDDETETAPESEVSPEVKEICGLYPYLKAEFVSDLLNKNSSLNSEYPEDTLITLAHSIGFDDEKTAAEFTEIMETAGYQCQAEGTAVTASKKLFTEDGAIISDIMNVANQAGALKGTYKDYQIQ